MGFAGLIIRKFSCLEGRGIGRRQSRRLFSKLPLIKFDIFILFSIMLRFLLTFWFYF